MLSKGNKTRFTGRIEKKGLIMHFRVKAISSAVTSAVIPRSIFLKTIVKACTFAFLIMVGLDSSQYTGTGLIVRILNHKRA